MKELKAKDITSVYELPHLYAHKKGNVTKGIYEIEDNEFYKDNQLIAIRFGNDVFLLKGVTSSSFGNGISIGHMSKAFIDLRYNIYYCDKLYHTIEACVINAVTSIDESAIYNLAKMQELLNNDRFQANRNVLPIIDNDKYVKLRAKYHKTVDFSFINKEIGQKYYTKYEGWSRYTTSIVINYTYKQLYTNRLYTKKELEIYNAKTFWHKYIKGRTEYFNRKGIKTTSLQNKIDVYNNETFNTAIIEDCKRADELATKLKEERLSIEITNAKIELFKWMNNDKPIMKFSYKAYDYLSNGLRLGKEDNVITSNGVSVPLKHCKLLYKIFVKHETNNTEFKANGNSINIGHYKVSTINMSRLNSIDQYVLTAGCHKISSDVIHKFVEINNLKW